MNIPKYDLAIVGAGIIGLAHAYHAARRGWRVLVLERCQRPEGASVRNFGMLWPIGQPAGERLDLARRSLEFWRDVFRMVPDWLVPCGSLHLAYEPDEEAVLLEFLERSASDRPEIRWIGPDEVRRRAPRVRPYRLRGALWSPLETCVDPGRALAVIPAHLRLELGVEIEWGVTVVEARPDSIRGGGRSWRADRVLVCGGDDLQTLCPEVLGAQGLVACKLQMMSTDPAPGEWRLGPMLAAGLTLRHYQAFEGCPSLPALRERFAREMPMYDYYGIHVMACQRDDGRLILGDSHQYGKRIDPFDSARINRLVLDYLDRFLDRGPLRPTNFWHGIYVKHPTEPWLVLHPEPGVTLVTGVGGAGMTLSFGLAERVIGSME